MLYLRASAPCMCTEWCLFYVPPREKKRKGVGKKIYRVRPCPGNYNNKEPGKKTVILVYNMMYLYIYIYDISYLSTIRCVDRKPPLPSTPRAFDPFPLIINIYLITYCVQQQVPASMYIKYFYNDVKIMYTYDIGTYVKYISRIKYLI